MSRPAAILVTLCATAAGTAIAQAGTITNSSVARPLHAHVRSTLAGAARALKASDTAHLHYLSASGALLFEEGWATGTLPGKMRAHVNIGATFTGSFTIYTQGGTLVGHGTATPHGSGVYESFAGSLVVSGGSDRYAHAHGRAGLYGTFDRNNYAFVVQTTGTLLY